MTLSKILIDVYPINEIFYSLQGESFHTGTPCVFVRFSGCNLRCVFCDTEHQTSHPMTSDEIVNEVMGYSNAQMIVLTGGEPSLFVDDELLCALKAAVGLPVAIETNGTRPIAADIDWVTLSPKIGLEGGDHEPCVLTRCDELKVVYCGQDLQPYSTIQTKYRFLQPCYCDDPERRKANLDACVEAVMKNPGWRLSLQIHRVLGIR